MLWHISEDGPKPQGLFLTHISLTWSKLFFANNKLIFLAKIGVYFQKFFKYFLVHIYIFVPKIRAL